MPEEEKKKTFYDICDPEIKQRALDFINKLKTGGFKKRSPYGKDLFKKLST
jgi:hypothetical protein